MNVAAIVMCAVLICAALLLPVVSIVIGKVKLKKALRPVEFYPPRGYSPVDVLFGYFGHKANAHNIINPLMLRWANSSYITIEEDCRRGLKLTKLKDIEDPEFENFMDITHQVQANFIYEKKLFDSIFETSDIFYTLAAPSIARINNNNFINDCNANAKDARTKITRTLYMQSILLSYAMLIITTLIIAISTQNMLFLIMVFPIIAIIFATHVRVEGEMQYLLYLFFFVWGGVPFIVMMAMPMDLSIKILLGAATVVCFTVVLFIARKIDIRTQKQIDIYGRIDAFKTFLLDAEIARLELLVEENPSYYYDILPYCYALNITEKLKPKFDRIIMDGPSWYLGELRDTLMF